MVGELASFQQSITPYPTIRHGDHTNKEPEREALLHVKILADLAPQGFITLAMEKQSWMKSRSATNFTKCCAQILHQASHSVGYFHKRLDIQQSGRKLVITIYDDFEEEDLKREQTKRMPRRGIQASARRKQRRALERSSGFSEDNNSSSSSCASPPPDPPDPAPPHPTPTPP